MLKKAGIVTVGVSAALLAASPMAFAGDASDSGHNGSDNDHGHHRSHGDDHGKGHKGHGKQHGIGNTQCASESGATKHNDTEGILALGPILNGNSGQILSCNSFLNDVASGNHINVLNGGI